MFEHAFVENGGSRRKSWTVAVSFVVQSLLVSLAVFLPLLSSSSLPAQKSFGFLLAPPPPAEAPPPKYDVQPEQVRRAAPRAEDSVFRAPAAIPEEVALLSDEDQPVLRSEVQGSFGIVGSLPGASRGGVLAFGARALEIKPPPEPEVQQLLNLPRRGS